MFSAMMMVAGLRFYELPPVLTIGAVSIIFIFAIVFRPRSN